MVDCTVYNIYLKTVPLLCMPLICYWEDENKMLGLDLTTYQLFQCKRKQSKGKQTQALPEASPLHASTILLFIERADGLPVYNLKNRL